MQPTRAAPASVRCYCFVCIPASQQLLCAAWLALTYSVLLRCILTVLCLPGSCTVYSLLVALQQQHGALCWCFAPGTSLACLAVLVLGTAPGALLAHKHLKVSCAGACVLCLVWFAYLFVC